MNNDNEAVYSQTFFLTAGETDARGEMPVTLLVERMIEVATNHANRLGIGFSTLSPMGKAWVLLRVGLKMDRVPGINAYYTISTWIESWNRLSSERCFLFTDYQGNVLGYGRTLWGTIDVQTRTIADLTYLTERVTLCPEKECDVPRVRNHPALAADSVRIVPYTFTFTDLDFNRHVNTVRYISHILDCKPLEHYDRYRVLAFEIVFRNESHAGQHVDLTIADPDPLHTRVDLVRDGQRVITSAITWIEQPIAL